MKNRIKYFLQKILGLQRYLYVFAIFKIRTLKNDKNENDFFTFLALMKDGEGAVLDVGANLGLMTAHLSKSLPNSIIHAFEPMPENLNILRKIIQRYLLKNTIVHPFAVGDQEGKLKMILPLNNGTVMQGLSHVKHPSIKEWNEGKEIEVAVKTIDSVLGNEKIQGIKIDVENFEYFALKGASKLLENQRPIVYAELWDNENRQQCFDLFKSLSYRICITENGQLIEFSPSIHQKQNFIFLPN